MPTARRGALAALLLLPGILVVYTAFHGGGFFAGTQGLLAVVLALLLLLRFTVAENPFGGAGAGLAVGGGALALFCGWILLSASWSHAPARALLEFDRALLYVLALVLFGTLPMTPRRLAWLLRGVAAAIVAVCTISFITRTLPHVWPVSPNIANDRLSYPITYWNTLGLLGALGVVLCVHLTCGEREPRWIRIAAAGAVPLLACTIYLTLSRGPHRGWPVCVSSPISGPGRPARGRWAACSPPCRAMAVAVIVAYQADSLATVSILRPRRGRQPGPPRGDRHGHLLCSWRGGPRSSSRRSTGGRPPARRSEFRRLGAPVGRSAPRSCWRSPPSSSPGVGRGYVGDQYDKFVHRKQPKDTGDLRERLTDPSSNGRVDEWRVAIDSWKTQRLHGTGAGTYQLVWNQNRPDSTNVFDGHSLYAEVLGEMGIVGLLLILAIVGALVVGAAVRIRGPDRALMAAAFAFLLLWGLRAGLDWDWEMPVVTLTAFCVGGAVLATPVWREGLDTSEEPRALGDAPRLMRVVLGLGCLLLAITPYKIAQSQTRLDDAVAAYRHGNCATAVDRALSSLDAEQVRPEPRLILTYCDLRFGQPTLALQQIQAAVKRDPDDWRLRYVLAVNLALLGHDPKPDMRRAHQLNPLENLPVFGLRRFASADTPKAWQRKAQRARLPGV